MKKINSENLWEFVNNLATNQKVKFKVFYHGDYITEIFWNGDYFEWEEGTFTSEGFFNPLYDFAVMKEDNDKLKHVENYVDFANLTEDSKFDYLYEMETRIIDHINKIEEGLNER